MSVFGLPSSAEMQNAISSQAAQNLNIGLGYDIPVTPNTTNSIPTIPTISPPPASLPQPAPLVPVSNVPPQLPAALGDLTHANYQVTTAITNGTVQQNAQNTQAASGAIENLNHANYVTTSALTENALTQQYETQDAVDMAIENLQHANYVVTNAMEFQQVQQLATGGSAAPSTDIETSQVSTTYILVGGVLVLGALWIMTE